VFRSLIRHATSTHRGDPPAMKLPSSALSRTAIVSVVAGVAIAGAPAPANASAYYNYWGALAISVRTGNTSSAINYGSANAAISAAVNTCGAYDCQAVVYFANACGAVAQAQNLSWGSGWGARLSDAESWAIRGTSGYGAHIVNWACTSNHQ
jgi:hypothetical protein